MELLTIIMWLKNHWKIATKALLVVSVAFLLAWGINIHRTNKKLSEQLEIVQNNVEAYLGALNGSLLAYNVIKLDMQKLSEQNDALIHSIDSVRKELKIKTSALKVAATQILNISVNKSLGVGGDLSLILKDTTYIDSILYNPLTKVYYAISKDSVNVGLKIDNTQYLYIYNTREYLNKKCFLKRLFTWDFKKVTKYKYLIENTNELLNTKDVRVIETILK